MVLEAAWVRVVLLLPAPSEHADSLSSSANGGGPPVPVLLLGALPAFPVLPVLPVLNAVVLAVLALAVLAAGGRESLMAGLVAGACVRLRTSFVPGAHGTSIPLHPLMRVCMHAGGTGCVTALLEGTHGDDVTTHAQAA